MAGPGELMQVVARPETVLIDPRSAAIVVGDMQNDFAAAGGMFDRAGIPIGGIFDALTQPVAALTASVLYFTLLQLHGAGETPQAS